MRLSGIQPVSRRIKLTNRARDAVRWTYNGTLDPIVQGMPFQITSFGAQSDTNEVNYDIVSGALPPGIELTTGLVGTPTTPGAYQFVVRAASTNEHIDVSFTLAVTPVTINWATPAGSLGTFYGTRPVTRAVAATTSNNQPVTYQIVAGALPGGLTFNPTTGQITGTLINANLTTQVTIRAIYANGIVTSDRTFSFTVIADAVVWTTSSSLGSYTGGDDLNLPLAAYSTSGNSLTFSLVSGTLPEGVSLVGAALTGKVADKLYASSFTIRATDGVVSSDRTFYLTGSLAQVIWATNSMLGSLPSGQTLPAFSASSKGGTVTFMVIAGALPGNMVLATNGTVTGTASGAGLYQFTIRASDGVTFTDRTFAVVIPSDTITWATSGNALATLWGGEPVNTPLSAVSSNNETITYSVVSGALPSGLRLTNGVITGTPDNVNGGFSFTIRALDADTFADQTFTSNVVAKVIAWTSQATQSFFTGHGPTGSFTATSSTGNALVYSVPTGSLPTGLTVSATGTIAGVATTAGTFTFTVRATDGHVSADRVFTYSVVADAITWVSTATALASLNGGVPVSQTLQANSAAGDPVTYSVLSGTLPPGLALANGVISGTPSNLGGTYAYAIKATDGTASANLSYSSNVIAAVVTWVSNAALPTTLLGSAFTNTVSATTTAPRPVTYSLFSGTLPVGLSLSSAGTISGTTTGNSITAVFTIRASDGVGYADKAFSLYVNGPPIWQTNPYLGNVAPNAPFSLNLRATDPDGIASYTQVGGDPLGNGVSLATSSNVGVLSGTLTLLDPNLPVWGTTNATPLVNVMRATPISVKLSANAANGRTIAGYSLPTSTATMPAGLTLFANGAITGTAELYSKDLNDDPISPYTPPVWTTNTDLGTRFINTTLTIPLNANPTSGANSSVYYAMSSRDVLPFGLQMNPNGVISGAVDPTTVSGEPVATGGGPVWNTANGSLGSSLNAQAISVPLSASPLANSSTTVSFFVANGTLPSGATLTTTNTVTGTATISGTLDGNATAASNTVSTARNYSFTVRAAANNGTYTDRNFTYTINVT